MQSLLYFWMHVERSINVFACHSRCSLHIFTLCKLHWLYFWMHVDRSVNVFACHSSCSFHIFTLCKLHVVIIWVSKGSKDSAEWNGTRGPHLWSVNTTVKLNNLGKDIFDHLKRCITTVFLDSRLSKSKHHRKRFQNFRQSYVVCLPVKFQFHTYGHVSLLAINNFFSATKTLHNILNWDSLNPHVVNFSKMALHC